MYGAKLIPFKPLTEKVTAEDFERVRPILPEVLMKNGRLRRGARTRIAAIQEIPDAGRHRYRIEAVLNLARAKAQAAA